MRKGPRRDQARRLEWHCAALSRLTPSLLPGCRWDPTKIGLFCETLFLVDFFPMSLDIFVIDALLSAFGYFEPHFGGKAIVPVGQLNSQTYQFLVDANQAGVR